VNPHLLLDLAGTLSSAPDGGTVMVAVSSRSDAVLASRWCDRTGNRLVAWDGDHVEIRRGRSPDPLADLPDDLRPGRRVWLYTNFDCNLACRYCCVSSSPRTPRRALGLDTIRAVAAQAPAVGTRELYLTGGEPFLLPDIGPTIEACVGSLPTVVLTNGMLFRGSRLRILESLPRERLALQISLDSAGPDRHDANRGEGTHARALAGIRTAIALGFRVRVAATLGPGHRDDEQNLHRLCDDLDIPAGDRVIRRIARQGAADEGVVVTRAGLIPEVCLTADGVYWHPVAAADPAMRVTGRILPLADAVDVVTAELREHRRRGDELARTFPCA
jgi:pyruvate-formate lyase-activating enzyme